MRKILKYVLELDFDRTVSFAMPASRRLLCINPDPNQPSKPAIWFEVGADTQNDTTEVVEFFLVKTGDNFGGVDHAALEYRGSALCGTQFGGLDLRTMIHIYEVRR